MSILNERIKERRLSLDFTLLYVADCLGVKEATVQRYESGEIKNIKHETIVKLAEILECSPAYLMGWDNHTKESNVPNVYPLELKKFPMLGEIACGIPKYVNEDRESYVMAGTNIHADFCLKANGDSMINARIYDGDIVFIKKQDMVENGEIAAVVINDTNEATLKRLFYYQDKSLLILKAENPSYEDLIFSKEELDNIHVLGKAIAFQSDVK